MVVPSALLSAYSYRSRYGRPYIQHFPLSLSLSSLSKLGSRKGSFEFVGPSSSIMIAGKGFHHLVTKMRRENNLPDFFTWFLPYSRRKRKEARKEDGFLLFFFFLEHEPHSWELINQSLKRRRENVSLGVRPQCAVSNLLGQSSKKEEFPVAWTKWGMREHVKKSRVVQIAQLFHILFSSRFLFDNDHTAVATMPEQYNFNFLACNVRQWANRSPMFAFWAGTPKRRGDFCWRVWKRGSLIVLLSHFCGLPPPSWMEFLFSFSSFHWYSGKHSRLSNSVCFSPSLPPSFLLLILSECQIMVP